MERYLSVKDIINCTKGELISGDENFICKDFTEDTRTIKKDDVYVGFKGDNCDGNLLWMEALDKGAKVVIVQGIEFNKSDIEKYQEKVVIKVTDTLDAIQNIAKYKRDLYGEKFPVIAITGSVGKTSTKDMIASVLSKKYKVLKTEGNNNNGLGVPLTILRLKDHDVAVVEMGMNHFGEIRELTNIAKPSLAVITNIGTSHIGNLGSRENILKAKLEILEGMKEPFVLINNDNDLLNEWARNNKGNLKIKTFGIDNKGDVYADNLVLKETGNNFNCYIGNNSFNVNMPIGGKHFVYDAVCAALVGNIFKLNNEEIKLGLEESNLTKKRMETIKLDNNITLINDSYNASYESMKAALEYLTSIESGRHIAVLGDMFELGEFSQEIHYKVGKEVAKNKIDVLICSGENSKYIKQGAIENGMNTNNIFYFDDMDKVEQKIKEIIVKNDNILIKASHGMKYFELADKLLKWGKM